LVALDADDGAVSHFPTGGVSDPAVERLAVEERFESRRRGVKGGSVVGGDGVGLAVGGACGEQAAQHQGGE